MGNCRKSKYSHVFYKLTRISPKSGEKVKNAIDWYASLMRRELVEGQTKWILKTKERAVARLKKFGIKQDKVGAVMQKKGINAKVDF